ncbi:MAG: aromatic amino acid transport family protein [Patescibacteria group bacterium]
MEARQVWTGMRPLLGTVIGVGIFGLPYAFAQVGFAIGLVALVAVGFLSLMALLLYSDLILIRNGHGRYLSVVGHELNGVEKVLAGIAYFGAHYGALLAYVIVGGSFAHAVFSQFLGGSELIYLLVFWLVGSLLAGGGLSFLVRLQGILFPLILLLVIIHAFVLAHHMSVSNLASFQPQNTVLSLGILLFAFSGLSAVPDMRDILKRNRKLMRRSLIVGMTVIGILYAVFSFLVVGVTGVGTSSEAITGLAPIIGPLAESLGSLLGLGIVMSAYLSTTVSLTNALVYDWRMGYLLAWGAVVALPMIFVLAGATNFISVIGLTGGILGSLLGIFLILAYERARISHDIPKNTLSIPQWLVLLTFFMYSGMLLLTITELVQG